MRPISCNLSGGPNYLELFIKSARDPNGIFISRKGVGIENWDDQGLCNYSG